MTDHGVAPDPFGDADLGSPRPLDRLLLAQAMEDGLGLRTADASLKRYVRFVKVV